MTQTLAQMTGAIGKISKAGYRNKRSTIVLGANSNYIHKLQDAKLNRALSRVAKVNFDFERLSNADVELLYAYFDKKMSQKIVAEFKFNLGMGNIQDHRACIASCDLCGKGDSRDDGANEDKLRYTFTLTNVAGGTDLKVGSNCIIQHGLHVDGAKTAAEAKEILRKSLSQHMAQWKIEAWQAEHPDHEEIPAQWQDFRFWSPRRDFLPELWAALGFDSRELDNERWSLWKPFRTASKFYDRKAHLPMNEKVKSGISKTQVWLDVKAMLALRDWTYPLLREARDLAPAYIRYGTSEEEKDRLLQPAIDLLATAKTKRDAKLKKNKKRRCPGKGKKRQPSRRK